MAKTLNNKNKKADNVDSETHPEKKSKKKKSKTVPNQNDEEPVKIKKKSTKKRQTIKDNELTAQEISPKKHKKDESNLDIKQHLSENEEESKEDEKKPRTISKRQMKKEKEEQRKAEQREAGRQEVMNKALSYISMWKHSRSQWKFEKIKQIWLMDNLLDDKAVPDSIFPTVLEYFEGCKGMARETLLKKGMDVIKMCEQKQESGKIIETVEYKRARELLQALPTET